MQRSSSARDLSDPAAGRDDYLCRLGERVREERARRGMTRRILARDSGLSERYLAQLESGKGNLSIKLLRRVADALNLPLPRLLGGEPDEPAELGRIVELLRRLPPDRLGQARALLDAHFAAPDPQARQRRIALIGLRGAGKSTLGNRLARHLDVPFIELDAEIERDFGLSLSEIFALSGQSTYRRSERRALDGVLDRHPGFVLAAGGSIVAESETYDELLARCFTVWIKASPEEHMSRVIAQGDLRPMSENKEAMADLERILAARTPLYARADAVVDTAGRSVEASFSGLLAILPKRRCQGR
jgi:XRE family aerobic/anaerobic benzoate catabolism transcriptional regulator